MKKNKNKTKVLVVILLITVFLGYIVYENRGKIQSANGRGKEILSFDSSQNYAFDAYNGNILMTSSDTLALISQNGFKVWERIFHMSKPQVCISGSMILHYDMGGRDISLSSSGSEIWRKKTEQKIITAKVNRRGYAILVTYEVGYKNKITVLSPKGEPVYIWQLGEDYVVDVDIASDGRSFAAATITPKEKDLTSKITVVDINLEKIIGEVTRADCLISNISYVTGGDIIALGESEMVGISSKGQVKWQVSYDGKRLEKFYIVQSGTSVLAFSGSRNNSIIEIYSKSGLKTGEFITDEKASSVHVLNNTLAVAAGERATFLNLKGRSVSYFDTECELQKVLLLSPRKAAIVLGNSIEIIRP
ncbi:MAG: DUF5711 family protein [Eubacteriales bacterium]|jgi:hypothetical protein|nr:DUF5711 family protein [Eubacteriales bacterium]